MANTIKSGWFSTSTNTPSGRAKAIAVDNPYLTKDEFLTHEVAIGLGITASSTIYTSGRLDKILLSASAQVNRITRRWMDTQTIDETKTGIQVHPLNPQLVSVVMQNRPYQAINSIYIQVLKWFIQIDTTASGYLQDFPDYGYYRIVPLLSNSGTGVGSPMPAEIVDKTPLGVIWTNYTFGYGTPLTGVVLSQVGGSSSHIFQAPLYQRLIAPSQTLTVYDNGTLVATTNYTVDYPNGIVTFIDSYTATGPITATYVSNESVPQDIKEAVALIAGEMVGQGLNNPLGASGYSIQTYSINWSGDKTQLKRRIDEMLSTYQNNMPTII